MSKKDINSIIQNATQYYYYVGTLDKATEVLSKAKASNKNIYIVLNGKKLYSQLDNIDSCYLKITGKTKKAFDMETKSLCFNCKER